MRVEDSMIADALGTLDRWKKWRESQGYVIDTYCWPWLAYQGNRFAPSAHIKFGDEL